MLKTGQRSLKRIKIKNMIKITNGVGLLNLNPNLNLSYPR